MKTEMVQMDQAGRLVLPKRVREQFSLEGGDTLSLAVRGEAIELRPVKAVPTLKRVNGVLVLARDRGWPSGRDVVAEQREARIQDVFRRGGGRR